LPPKKPKYETLLRSHQGAVRNFLRRLCGSHALADDLAQDCFIKAYKSYSQLKNHDAALSWLFEIAYRCFYDHLRKEKRRQSLWNMAPDMGPDMAQSSPSSVSKLDLESAIETLPPDCRACIILCLGYGYTQNDVATITSMPIGTVKSHINRGKTRLKAFLSAYATVN